MILPFNLSLLILLLFLSAYATADEIGTDKCLYCNGNIAKLNSTDKSLTIDTDIVLLANSKTWQRLVYLEKINGRWKSDIKDAGFYLSSPGELTPLTELLGTLKAFSEPVSKGDDHAVCRYPSRYQWLTTVAPTLKSLPKPICKSLFEWLSKSKDFPVNMVHVSGYFGNPASAFGHLLLRIGRVGNSNDRGLSDTGVNFGARIPQNENAASYILNGIFGGYAASFTDQPHYVQDLVYSGIESRDMWNYELGLTSEQRSLLLNHLWEVRRIPFSYYFLSKNCAYRIAQILELVLDADFIKKPTFYYLPIDVFYTLERLDTNSDKQNIVTNITFIPSKKRELVTLFNSLSIKQKESIRDILNNSNFGKKLFEISDSELDFLNQYVDFLLVASSGQANDKITNLKDQILLVRLNRPITDRDQAMPIISPLPAPGLGQRARVARIATSMNKSTANLQEITFSPYSFDLLNNNRGSLTHSSFHVLETKIGITSDETKLQQLNFIAIERYAEPAHTIDGTIRTPYSWRAALTYTEPMLCTENCGRLESLGSIGLASPLFTGLAHGLVDSRVNLTEGDIALGVTGGIRWAQGERINHIIRSSFYKYLGEGRSQTTHRFSSRYRPTRDQALTFSISNRTDSQFKIAYDLRW